MSPLTNWANEMEFVPPPPDSSGARACVDLEPDPSARGTAGAGPGEPGTTVCGPVDPGTEGARSAWCVTSGLAYAVGAVIADEAARADAGVTDEKSTDAAKSAAKKRARSRAGIAHLRWCPERMS